MQFFVSYSNLEAYLHIIGTSVFPVISTKEKVLSDVLLRQCKQQNM
jgi:hypothetical protein